MSFSKSKVLTMSFHKSKIRKLERRFTLDPKNRKAENRKSTNGNDFLHSDEGRQGERRGSEIERQASRTHALYVGCSKSRRNGENNCEQEIKKGLPSYRGKYRTPQRNTGLRQRTLFIVAFLLPLSSQFQLR